MVGGYAVKFLFICFCALLVIGFLGNMRKKKQNRVQSRTQSSAVAAISNFNPVVRYDGIVGGKGLAIDPARESFAILSGRGGSHVFGFSGLVQVDVLRNGTSLQQTNRGSQIAGAAVGAVLLGPLGLLMGGVSGSKRNVEIVNQLSLKLYTNDIVSPVHEIIFFKGKAKPANADVVNAAKELDAWYGRFRTILTKHQPGIAAA